MSADGDAADFLGGKVIDFMAADALWQALRTNDKLSLARAVLDRMDEEGTLFDSVPASARAQLARQRAMLTSKDPELGAAFRHDRALAILSRQIDLADPALDGQMETLGIAAGIHKRRWQDLGQLQDLQCASAYYRRAAGANLGGDAYAHINAAFLDDLLAHLGDNPQVRRGEAMAMRERIVGGLKADAANWFNIATRAEAFFGLRRFEEATQELKSSSMRGKLWEVQTMARQLGQLAAIYELTEAELPAVHAFFNELIPGNADAAFSMAVGKVGLALSGGGFRASFYHLGVLARLAEHDMLRHIDVLSCVSGGSIVGAAYWLALRKRMLEPKPLQRGDYVGIVAAVIEQFSTAVEGNLRGEVQPGKLKAAFRLVTGEAKGLLDPVAVADVLDERFYRPWMPEANGPIMMHQLAFDPADFDRKLAAGAAFNPGLHNWLREHKVPALVLNATCVNTGHAWQFTPKWMGESPWAVHEEADSVPRLEWADYAPLAKWQMPLGQAVAASTCVPGVFDPLKLGELYQQGVQVQLVDGGVFDNQGTVALLAMNCNVVLVSDACGQLLLEKAAGQGLSGLGGYAKRAMDALMERVRGANHADLSARRLSGQLRRLMFLHMKAGLYADTNPRITSQAAQTLKRTPLTRSGVRRDLQQKLAELRTDLDIFSRDEQDGLMACGCEMAGHAIARDLRGETLWVAERLKASWCFDTLKDELKSVAETTVRRDALLEAFSAGSKVQI